MGNGQLRHVGLFVLKGVFSSVGLPARHKKEWDISSVGLEHYLDKVGVVSSNLTCPTIKNIISFGQGALPRHGGSHCFSQ